MRAAWGAMAALALLAFAPQAQGQSDPVVRVDFSNPGLIPAHWTMTLHPDGSGHFQSERGSAPAPALQTSNSPRVIPPDQDRDIHVSAKFAERVFASARSGKWSNKVCESNRKVAFQGLKKLSYTGPDGQRSCEFNYSADKQIEELGDSLVAVASTILEGARLRMLLLHDRLGLDDEMEYLVEAQADGRVQQVCAIRETLERLADNPGVMDRVRRKARVLLEKTDE